MSDYIISESTLTNIAKPLRSLTGKTEKLTPAEMAAAGTEANTEAQTQTTLIEQIKTVLDGKGNPSGGGGDPTLPDGYVRCSYIALDGTQKVDTGIVCTQNTKIRIVYTRDSDDTMYLYGVVNSGNTASVTAYLSTSGGTWRFGNKSATAMIAINEELIQTAIVDKTGFIRPHLTQALSEVNDFETIGSLIIGAARNADGTVASAQFVGKIMLFEMWSGEELVRKLTPVTDGKGVYRFYDTVSQTFFDSITDSPLGGGNL